MKVENICVTGFKASLRGMRNPKNSWDRSDTIYWNNVHYLSEDHLKRVNYYQLDKLYDYATKSDGYVYYKPQHYVSETPLMYNPITQAYFFASKDINDNPIEYIVETDRICLIGPNDMQLCKTLLKGGPVHAKFDRYLIVTMDITGSFDFWKEYDTYKVATVANSCSTMHTITKYEITIDNFSTSDLTEEDIEHIKSNIDYLNKIINDDNISDLEKTRRLSKLNLLAFEQKRTVQFDYRVMSEMYKWRTSHKLKEWRWLTNNVFKFLPYFEEFYIQTKETKENA